MAPGLFIRGSFIALALLSAGGFAASADDGRPPAPSGAGRPPTTSPIPLTELRPSEIRTAPVPTAVPGSDPVGGPLRLPERKKELVIFVGGDGSQGNEGAFGELLARLSPGPLQPRGPRGEPPVSLHNRRRRHTQCPL